MKKEGDSRWGLEATKASIGELAMIAEYLLILGHQFCGWCRLWVFEAIDLEMLPAGIRARPH